MGRCFDQCNGGFAFAIVQDNNCWCSDYIPANQVSTGDCNVACPGYPDDLCGNSAEGLYGYVKLSKAAAGTAGASSSPATTSTSSAGRTSLSSTQELAIDETTPTPIVPIVYTPSSSFVSTSSQSQQSSSSPRSTPSPLPPTTSIQTITQGGSTIVQIMTVTPTAPATANLPAQQRGSGGISGGLIAAAVVASILGVALIGALVWFFMRKRRRDNDDHDEKYGDINDDPSSPSNLNRNISTHSKAGLLDRGYNTAAAARMSRVSSTNGPEMSSTDGISPVTPNSERRSSRLVMYDQRLNPNALMVIDNGSRTSLNTLDDHRDYGRQLKIMNPDSNRPSMSRGRSFE